VAREPGTAFAEVAGENTWLSLTVWQFSADFWLCPFHSQGEELTMRTGLVCLAALMLAAPVFGRDDESAKELKKLEGVWIMVSGEKEGEKLPDEMVKKNKIVWKGKKVEVTSPHQSDELIKATIKVDASKTPHEMEWVRDNGPDAGKTMYAIYEWIDGDHYRVCFAKAGKEKPKEFSTKAGSGHMMHVWKRVRE
jgi:uncharacterized protein (TIGR03067 family)